MDTKAFRGRGRGRWNPKGHNQRQGPPRDLALVDRRFAMQPLTGTTCNEQEYHPPSRTQRPYENHQFPQDARYFCDRCFKGYNSSQSYQLHMQNHIKCVVEGCTFEALPRFVAKHMLSLHAYNVQSGKDISKTSAEKWIESRKRNYPSQETAEMKHHRQEAQVERGEVLETRNQFGKFRMASMKPEQHDRSQDSSPAQSGTKSIKITDKSGHTEGTSQLIEKLLANEIRHERNVILQCIRHITNHKDEFGIGVIKE